MRRILILLLFFLPIFCPAEDFSRDKFKKLEVTYQVLNAVDAAQTIYLIGNGCCKELNPLLPTHPSPMQILAFKSVAGIAHYILAKKIYDSDPEMAKIFEYATIAVQGTAVGLNFRYVF